MTSKLRPDVFFYVAFSRCSELHGPYEQLYFCLGIGSTVPIFLHSFNYCMGCFYEENSQNVTASVGLVLHLLWFISHVSCEQSCPLPSWLSVLQLQMTLELCPDTSAFCAPPVDPAYCLGRFLPEILSRPSSSCQTSRNVCDRCDQSLTGGLSPWWLPCVVTWAV